MLARFVNYFHVVAVHPQLATEVDYLTGYIKKIVRETEKTNTIEEQVRNLSVFSKGTKTGTQLESPSTEQKVTARLNRLIHLILCPF